jgi:predicted nucleotidyltransferase
MIQECTTYRIANAFFNDPLKKFGLKEISLISGIAHTSVKKELERLIKHGLVKKRIEIKGKRKFPLYYASINENFLSLKKIFNEYEIRYSGLIEYLDLNLMPNSIILFGSFSKGEDTAESDVDIFVESEIKEIDLSKFEKKLHRKINLIFKEDINSLKQELLNSVVNGVILYGDIKLRCGKK